jgi:hypothetical protein
MAKPTLIYLGGGEGPGGQGGITKINTDGRTAKEEIKPGMCIVPVVTSGQKQWERAGADPVDCIVALEQSFAEDGVDTPYAIGDLVLAGSMHVGTLFAGYVRSGESFSDQALLESDGDGGFQVLGSGDPIARSEEATGGTLTEDTLIRMTRFK